MGEVRLAKKAVQSRDDHSRNTDGRNRQGRPHYRGRKILLGLAAWEGFPNREGVSSMRYSQEEGKQTSLATVKGIEGSQQDRMGPDNGSREASLGWCVCVWGG